jgi:hypothetical protein
MRWPKDGPVPKLTLSARWGRSTGFELDIILPTPLTLNLGHRITTDPFTLQIKTQPPTLILDAGLKVPVPRGSQPLHFTMNLGFNAAGGGATGQMSGNWNDPFGISNKLTIGPNVLLTIAIVFEEFVPTGIPKSFGFAGGLRFGKAQAHVAYNISEIPSGKSLSIPSSVVN